MITNILKGVMEIFAYGFMTMVFYVHLSECIRRNRETKD